MKNRQNKSRKKKSTASLDQIQKAFAYAIMTPLADNFKSRKEIAKGIKMKDIADAIMKPNDRLTSFERLEIYNRQYWFRIIDNIYDDFTAVRNLLGDKLFYPLIQAYLLKFPSKSYTLRNVGSRFPEFLQKYPSFAGKRAKIAIEMARFEWAQIEAFDGPSRPVLDPSKIKTKSPNKIKLKLQPYITLLELNYALDDLIIKLHEQERADRSEASSDDAPKKIIKPCRLPKKEKVYLVVHRYNNLIYYKRLDLPAYIILKEIQKGAALGPACDKASHYFSKKQKKEEQLAGLTQLWFTSWNNLGWFCV